MVVFSYLFISIKGLTIKHGEYELIVQITLTPSEGKRLIAKAIVSLPQVQYAYKEGIVIIATSTTTSYVAEELMNKEIKKKGMFTAGVVTRDGCQITKADERYSHYVLEKGKLKECKTSELKPFLSRMGPKDVFIKGANAIDPFGAAGVLLHGEGGGTIGMAWGFLTSNGIPLIIAAGLEKLVPVNLSEAATRTGKNVIDKAMGWKCGMIVIYGQIITEMEALKILYGVEVIPIGGGGINGGEGCKIFLLEGNDENVEAAYKMTKEIKGEPLLNCETIFKEMD
jgi:hypothetical protein